MYVSVGHAARTLGVTADTVRRWTSTGLLPCVRTAGGHRRMTREDVDELKRAIDGSGHLQARRAREREVDTLTQASIDLVSMRDRQELLAAIARHVTRLCGCSSCAISEYDASANVVRLLAEFDATGRRLPQITDFSLECYPVTVRALREQKPVVVNVDDRGADPAEVALLRRFGDRSVLMVPLVFRDETIGLLEAVDWERSRRYSPQELRLVRALAGHAAVALRNAELLREEREEGDAGTASLAVELAVAGRRLADVRDRPPGAPRCEAVAELVCDTFAACSCLVTRDGHVVGAALSAVAPGDGADRRARVLRGDCATPAGPYELVLTLTRPVRDGELELLQLLAAATAGSV